MRVPAAKGHQAIAASALSRRDIESTITFLSEKRVFADDPAMQVMQFGDLRDFPGFELHGVFAGRSADLVQRHQLSTTCKEHAADVMEQYATFFALLSNDSHAVLVPRMLDMAEQFRLAPPGVLGRHVFWIGDALRSEDVLRELLEPDSIVGAASTAALEESLVKYGPGLITSFRVYDDFKDRSLKCHTGTPMGTFRNKFGKERRYVRVQVASFRLASRVSYKYY